MLLRRVPLLLVRRWGPHGGLVGNYGPRLRFGGRVFSWFFGEGLEGLIFGFFDVFRIGFGLDVRRGLLWSCGFRSLKMRMRWFGGGCLRGCRCLVSLLLPHQGHLVGFVHFQSFFLRGWCIGITIIGCIDKGGLVSWFGFEVISVVVVSKVEMD